MTADMPGSDHGFLLIVGEQDVSKYSIVLVGSTLIPGTERKLRKLVSYLGNFLDKRGFSNPHGPSNSRSSSSQLLAA
jgi:hypothetical protein